MSARRRRQARRDPVVFETLQNLWWQAADLRDEWLTHALSSAPADRAATEDAITSLYALLERPPPEFVWVGSPAAALDVFPPAPEVRFGGPWPFESQLATLAYTLRERLDRRAGAPRSSYAESNPLPPDPLAELRSGVPLKAVVDSGVRGALRSIVRGAVAGQLRAAIAERIGLTWYGQHEADWVALYDVHQRVLGTQFNQADTAQLALWATLVRSCGWWWPREDVCVIAERPSVIHTEPITGSMYGEVRLHNVDGPAVVFPDGWSVHSWHGTRVPSWVIEPSTSDSGTVQWNTVELITAERNVEVRRCAIERMGWPAFIDQAGLVLAAQAPDPGNPGSELRLYDLPYTSNRLLLAVNGSVERDGTRRQYGLHVPSWFDDPIDAAGWSYGLTGPQYALLRRRT